MLDVTQVFHQDIETHWKAYLQIFDLNHPVGDVVDLVSAVVWVVWQLFDCPINNLVKDTYNNIIRFFYRVNLVINNEYLLTIIIKHLTFS